MKKIDLSTFVCSFMDEIKEFEEKQLTYDPETLRTMEEWINNFLIYCGYEEEEEDSEVGLDDYDSDFEYLEDFEYRDLVNRRKYRSFRDDNSY